MVKEGIYQVDEPIVPAEDVVSSSPLKLHSMAYNEKTIKQKTNLDKILEKAKKQFESDKLAVQKQQLLKNAEHGSQDIVTVAKPARKKNHVKVEKIKTDGHS